MKKYVLSAGLIALMGLGAHGVYADEMMVESVEKIAVDEMSYSNFTLENIKKELAGRNGESVIEAEFDMISGNTLWDDYEYNNTHYYSKKLQTNVYIPEGLKRYISKAQIQITREAMSPIMYDMPQAKEATSTPQESVMQKDMTLEVSVDALSEGSVSYDPQVLRAMSEEYGSSFTAQVELVMQNGKVIPFSHPTYLYIQADNVEGKKAHLANYYYSLNPTPGYPDLDSMLKNAFTKLRAASADSDAYLASLKKVRAKVEAFTEDYNANIEKMVADIDSDADFDAVVKDYGKVYSRSNLLWDIGYRIDSEMSNDDAQKLIDELFTIE